MLFRSQTDWYAQQDQLPARSLLVQSPNFYDFLPFVALSQPMVASADPKTRASNQLQDNYAFNYSINSPTFEGLKPDQIAAVLDFLQVRSVLVGFPTSSSQDGLRSNPEVIGRLGDVLTPSGRFTLPRASFDVYSRSEFSAFVIPRRSVSGLDTCPILQEQCALLARSTPVEPSESPKLTLCRKDCLWRFASPAIDEDMALVIPVTYDNTLVVNSADGTRLKTASAGGFLSVFGDAPVPAGELTIALRPDFRMWSRVAASYVNILMVLVLLSMMLFPKLSSLHRARERGPKPQHS